MVESNHGSVFGGFTTKDSATKTDRYGFTDDSKAFLYRIKSRPDTYNPKIFNLKDPKVKTAVKIKSNIGPQWGNGDLLIAPVSGCHPDAYEATANELCGGTTGEVYKVKDYEVYLVEPKPFFH